MFYLISFLFGGCAFALLYFVKPENIIMKNGVYVGKYPLKIAMLGGIVGFIISNIAFKCVKNKMTRKDMFCKIIIQINNKKVEVKALIDSGNLLKEPISGYPVIIVEKYKLKEVLPMEILDNLDNILKGDFLQNSKYSEYISKFRLIPFSSLGKQNGMLLGIKVDHIKIINEEEVLIRNSIIAIYNEHLSKNENYAALVGLDLLEGRINDEFTQNVKI